MLIDYIMPYRLSEDEGKTGGLLCQLRCLAQIRQDCHIRLFAPYCNFHPELPDNITLVTQRSITFRIVQELFLNIIYLFYLMKKRPTCMIVRPDALFTAHFFAKLLKVRLILNLHAYVKEECGYVYQNIFGKFYIRIVHAILCLSIMLSDGIVFNHPDLQNYIVRNYAYSRPTQSIYNGANTARFYPVDKYWARQTLSIPADKTILLFLGSGTKWHGVDYLTDIASIVQEKSNDILFYIVGGHPSTASHMQELADASSKNVIFTGKVGLDRANLFINASDVCLLPVKNIRVSPGSPRKLFDYIAVGRPVITQETTTGYSDIVEAYELGYTIDFGNSHQAAERIIAIVKECREKQYDRHNREVAMNHLNWSNIASQWNAYIETVMNSRIALKR